MTAHNRFHVRGCWFAVLTLAVVCIVGSPSLGDEPVTPEVKEPVPLNVPYMMDSSGAIVSLERQEPQRSRRAWAVFKQVNEAHSPVRLTSSHELAFLIRSADPSKWKLFTLRSEKNRRAFVPIKPGIFRREGPGRIPFETVNLGDWSYKLIPSRALAPGEYGFIEDYPSHLFCFGVDPAK